MLAVLEMELCGNSMLKKSTSSKAFVRFPVSHALWILICLELA